MDTQLCYDLIDFKKVVTITSLVLRAVNQNWIHTVSLKRFIDGHAHNNDILGYEQCVEKM